jgi:transcriptional regulator with XRE-family HTH domain
MADTFKITERNYQRYEATDSPSNDTLLKLATFFGVSTDYLLGRTAYKYCPNADGNIVTDTPADVKNVINLENLNTEEQRLQILFDELLQSYAVWLRNAGIPISGGGNSDMVVVEVEEGEFYDVSGSIEAILKMGAEHFKIIARQLGKRIWE